MSIRCTIRQALETKVRVCLPEFVFDVGMRACVVFAYVCPRV